MTSLRRAFEVSQAWSLLACWTRMLYNDRNFGRYIKWSEPFRSGPTRIFGTSFVHFNWSGHFGRSDRNIPLHVKKCCPQYHSFASFLQEQYNQPRGGLGRVCATGIYCSIGNVEFQRKYQTKIFVKGKAPKVYSQLCLNEHIYKVATLLPLFDSLDETNT